MLPMALTFGASEPSTTAAVARPRFCCTRGLTVTVPVSAPPAPAYTGTSIMSMKGDLAGASKRLPGTIGSW
jgi:hypothetical protein